ncbi:MAG: hypothetical protein EXR21_08400 [Flavobacteriaceae bacterium]|nr:hypothetical protein [Flavobacteriaceae bacterium]
MKKAITIFVITLASAITFNSCKKAAKSGPLKFYISVSPKIDTLALGVQEELVFSTSAGFTYCTMGSNFSADSINVIKDQNVTYSLASQFNECKTIIISAEYNGKVIDNKTFHMGNVFPVCSDGYHSSGNIIIP